MPRFVAVFVSSRRLVVPFSQSSIAYHFVPSSSLDRCIKYSPSTRRGSFGLSNQLVSAEKKRKRGKEESRKGLGSENILLFCNQLHALQERSRELHVEVLANWRSIGRSLIGYCEGGFWVDRGRTAACLVPVSVGDRARRMPHGRACAPGTW